MPVKRVLLVDDSATERHVIGEMLKKSGYDVLFATSGEEGVARSRSENPDLIVMDVVMPGLNGFQACRTITQDPQTRHIPVILCTTKNQQTDRIWAIRQGARDYVTKPVDAAELLGKIASQG